MSPISAPEGSFYNSVAIDSNGNYIVADSGQHQILRISPSSPNTPQLAVSYVSLVFDSESTEDVYVRVDSFGNYIVADDNVGADNPIIVFSVTPAGAISTVNVSPTGQSSPPFRTFGLTLDAQGNYIVVDLSQDTIFTIAPYGGQNAGASTPLFTDPNGYLNEALGISYDPLSGDFFLVDDVNDALHLIRSLPMEPLSLRLRPDHSSMGDPVP